MRHPPCFPADHAREEIGRLNNYLARCLNYRRDSIVRLLFSRAGDVAGNQAHQRLISYHDWLQAYFGWGAVELLREGSEILSGLSLSAPHLGLL
jgi:hypothetical protein